MFSQCQGLYPLRWGSTAKCRKHFNDTLYCWIHIDIVFKEKYQRCTPLGKGEKHCSFIFLPGLNQSNFAPPRAKTPPECSSSTPTCFRDLKRSKSLGRNLLLVFLQYICWYDLDWARSASQKVPLWTPNCEKNKVTFDLKKKKTVGIYSPRMVSNGFTLKDERNLAEL